MDSMIKNINFQEESNLEERNPQKLLEKITSMMDVIMADECPDASSCDRCKLYLHALDIAK